MAKRTVVLLVLAICVCIYSLFSSGQETLILINCLLIITCFASIYMQIKNTTKYDTAFCDGRLWFFSAILIYTIVVPIYGLLTHVLEWGIRPLGTIADARTYTAEELLKTTKMSLLFFCGMTIGFFVRRHLRVLRKENAFQKPDKTTALADNRLNNSMFVGWTIIAGISTLVFLAPFLRGGFNVLRSGGTITDVTSLGLSVQNPVISIFFSAEVMTIASVAMVYYWFKTEVSRRSKLVLMVAMVAFQLLLAFATTRRARALTIVVCVLLIYVDWYFKRKKRMPRFQIVAIACVGIVFYFLEMISEQAIKGVTFISALSFFDGFGPYDAFLLSAREAEPAGMISNVLYGLCRHIPILGKNIISLFGMNTSYPPLYIWMARRYSLYALGGGLAYMPQLEAYLTGGMPACLLFGAVYGFIFAMPKKGILNYVIVALGFMVARGSLQVLLQLMWPYVIVSYLLHDQFLLRMRWRHKEERRTARWPQDSLKI